MINQENKHERDKRITFEPESHTYYIDGSSEGYNSVTQFIGEYFPKFDADKVIKNNYDKWQSNPNSKYYGMGKQEIKSSWNKKREKSSQDGTILHEDIERYLLGEKVSNSSREWAYFLNFYKNLGEVEPYRTEWFVFDEELKLAGSIDSLFIDSNNNFYMVDWKRSEELKKTNAWETGFHPITHLPSTNYYKYCLQLNIYSHILKKNYGVNVDKLYLVRLHPYASDYELYEVEDMSEEVNKLLNDRKKKINY